MEDTESPLTPTSFLTIHGAAFSSSFNVGRDAGSIGPRTDISEVVAMTSLPVFQGLLKIRTSKLQRGRRAGVSVEKIEIVVWITAGTINSKSDIWVEGPTCQSDGNMTSHDMWFACGRLK